MRKFFLSSTYIFIIACLFNFAFANNTIQEPILTFSSKNLLKNYTSRVSFCNDSYAECMTITNNAVPSEYLDLFPTETTFVQVEQIFYNNKSSKVTQKDVFPITDLEANNIVVEFDDHSQILVELK